VFRVRPAPKQHKVDYLGAGLLAGGLSAVVLFTSLGGSTWAWNSSQIITLIVISVIAIAGFVFVEARVQEPIMPLSLFRNRTFAVTSAVGFIVGLSLFGAVTYLPLYLQIVKGVSATKSGLQLTPMMLGLLVTSVLSGQLISRWGRYRVFPIAGTAVVAVGMGLLSRLGIGTSLWMHPSFSLPPSSARSHSSSHCFFRTCPCGARARRKGSARPSRRHGTATPNASWSAS
jgi:predicted MFS family arabinose efflux permease